MFDWDVGFGPPNYGLLGTDRGLILPENTNRYATALMNRGVVHSSRYDVLGRRVAERTRNNAAAGLRDDVVASKYDALGRRVRMDGPGVNGGTFQTYAYDQAGLSYGQDAGTCRVSFAYDKVADPVIVAALGGEAVLDRVRVTGHYKPQSVTPEMLTTDTYDPFGRLTLEERKGRGDARETFTPAAGAGGGFVLPPSQQAKGFTLDASRVYIYDEAGQVKRVASHEYVPTEDGKSFVPKSNVRDVSYGADGGPIFETRALGRTPGNPDRQTFAIQQQTSPNGQSKTDFHVRNVYDGEGGLLATVRYTPKPEGSPNGSDVIESIWRYTYDHQNRLVKASLESRSKYMREDGTFGHRFGPVVDVLYYYDAEGHLLRRAEVWRSFPDPSRVANGFLPSAATGDRYQNPIEPPAGQVGRDVAWSVRDLNYVPDGGTFAGYYQNGGPYTHVVWNPGSDAPLARQSTNGAPNGTEEMGTKWYVTDRQGNVLGLVHTTQVSYATNGDPAAPRPPGSWAKVLTYAGPQAERAWAPDPPNNGFAFQDELEVAGRPWDYITQLQDNRARWFSPALGHFTAKDTWGYGAGDTNLYRYAGNDWPNATDPSGHFLLATAVAGLAGFAAGMAVGPAGVVEPKAVEEAFVRHGLVWHLHAGGQVIRTAPEHPFFVHGKW